MNKTNRELIRQLADEIDTFDTMLSSLVELLEEKRILTQKEFENKVKGKTIKAGGIKSFRDIQFANK